MREKFPCKTEFNRQIKYLIVQARTLGFTLVYVKLVKGTQHGKDSIVFSKKRVTRDSFPLKELGVAHILTRGIVPSRKVSLQPHDLFM